MKLRFLIGGLVALALAGVMAFAWGGCDWFFWDPICWFSGEGLMDTVLLRDPLFSLSAIGVVFLLVLAFALAIDRYEEDRQRREQEQHEDAMTQARMELTVRLTALRGIK